MEKRSRVSWSDLPEEIIQRILRCFHTETDVLRIRAVCNSWRSLVTPFNKSTLKLPFPITDEGDDWFYTEPGEYFNLIERTVYRVQLPENQSSTESKEPNCWLVKVEKSRDGRMRVLNPVSDLQIKFLHETHLPKVLNTLDFRVSEVCKVYALQNVIPSTQRVEYAFAKKVVVSGSIDTDDYVVMVINQNNDLWYTKSGEKGWHWSLEDILDVVNYKGQFYAIDFRGTWVFDSSFDATLIALGTSSGSSKNHFVESLGELFLVEEVLACNGFGDYCACVYEQSHQWHSAVDVRISKLDKEKKEWVEVKKLEDRILFAGNDCSFSVSAQEFSSCKATRVFLTNSCSCFKARLDVAFKFRGLQDHKIGVCDYETGRLGSILQFPEYADIFWPPPSWLKQS